MEAQARQGKVLAFKPATKKKAKLRMAIVGPPGSGKTMTALRVAQGLVPNGRYALIDTERGSASKYADKHAFDTLELTNFHPQNYVDAIRAAEGAGFDVIIIDSLSHAWSGKGGLLEELDNISARNRNQQGFSAWKEATPIQNRMVDAILGAAAHVIVTMRVKTEYVVEKDDRGKNVPRKVGLAPVQRDGVEYEFDVLGEIDQAHRMVITKTRCDALSDAVLDRPGPELGVTLREWLTDGSEAPAAPRVVEPEMKEEPLDEPLEPGSDIEEGPPQATNAAVVRNPAPAAKATASPSTQLNFRRSRLWHRRPKGMAADAFRQWVTKTLGADKPSAEWTADDISRLEAAQRQAQG